LFLVFLLHIFAPSCSLTLIAPIPELGHGINGGGLEILGDSALVLVGLSAVLLFATIATLKVAEL